MQVTLDLATLEELTAADGDPPESSNPSCYDLGWNSDSAIQYFEAAECLLHLRPHLDAATLEHLDQGIGRLLAENGQLDEYGTADTTEGHGWISVSPETTRALLAHIEAVDLERLIEILRRHPGPVDDAEAGLRTMFTQHRAMVREAAARGLGLLGHCG